jgi:PGAP1-like protein
MQNGLHPKLPIFLLSTLATLLVRCSCAAAVQADVRQMDLPVLSASTRIAQKPNSIELLQADRTVIGSRKPLVLINGLHSEYLRQCHWTKMMKHLTADSEFNKTFKVYFARYDSEAPLSETAPAFKRAIGELYARTGGRQATIVALSMGGNVVQFAMCDKQLNSKVARVLTLGTPFHGSPLFTEDWIQYSLHKNRSVLLSRYVDSETVSVYLKSNRILAKYLGWDNFDRRIPSPGRFRSFMPFGPKGVLTAEADANTSLCSLNSGGDLDRTKFVTYAAYLPNQYTGRPHSILRSAGDLLTSQLLYTSVLPKPRRRPILHRFNWELSRVICKSDGTSSMSHPYALNDGVAPITSALLLHGSASENGSRFADESSIEQLRSEIDVGSARLFRGIDHLTFVDGSRPLFSPKLIKDQLNPSESGRSIFDWVKLDLMNSVKTENAQGTAAGGKS